MYIRRKVFSIVEGEQREFSGLSKTAALAIPVASTALGAGIGAYKANKTNSVEEEKKQLKKLKEDYLSTAKEDLRDSKDNRYDKLYRDDCKESAKVNKQLAEEADEDLKELEKDPSSYFKLEKKRRRKAFIPVGATAGLLTGLSLDAASLGMKKMINQHGPKKAALIAAGIPIASAAIGAAGFGAVSSSKGGKDLAEKEIHKKAEIERKSLSGNKAQREEEELNNNSEAFHKKRVRRDIRDGAAFGGAIGTLGMVGHIVKKGIK